jgi:hypothetical protein
MSDNLSRRQLLQATGGITFLALSANGRGAFAVVPEMLKEDSTSAPEVPGPLPLFTAQPYIQPGPIGPLPADGAESMVLVCQTNDSTLHTKNRLIPGNFTIDQAFDGIKQTGPNGIIYITTGAGGKHLYDIEDNANPDRWKHLEDNHVEYIARFISDRHSITAVDLNATALNIQQVDQWGNVVDRFTVTK